MNKKSILITGANRGIGLAASKNLLKNDHYVIATARSSDGIKRLEKELSEYSDKQILLLDVSSEENIKQCCYKVSESNTSLDCLINNAGVFYHNPISETPSTEMLDVFKTNTLGPMLMAKALIPLLQKSSDAKIINVSSQMGSIENGGAGYASYRITKTALNSLTRNLHFDYAEKGIRSYSVCPGWVHTDMGGPKAPRTPEQGAASILYPFYNDVKSGAFLQDGKELKW